MMIMMMVMVMVTMMVNICEYDCDLVMKVILVKEVMSCDVSPVAMFLVGILSFYTQKFFTHKSKQYFVTPNIFHSIFLYLYFVYLRILYLCISYDVILSHISMMSNHILQVQKHLFRVPARAARKHSIQN